jgi:hypothetical protein
MGLVYFLFGRLANLGAAEIRFADACFYNSEKVMDGFYLAARHI